MPVRKDEHGHRSVEVEVEVPGTAEDVWRAIATGQGISSWFVPTRSDEREGGQLVCSFGPGMDSVAMISKWDPPHGFVAETEEGPGKIATEWLVETRSGGTCAVRVVHRWFADTDAWDAQFEGHSYGWAAFFRILRQYLYHFNGQQCSAFQLSAFSEAPAPEVWRTVTEAISLDRKARHAKAIPGSPVLAGDVESIGPDAYPELLVRLEQPAPGLAHIFVLAGCGPTMLSIRFYLYGKSGAEAVASTESQWRDWLAAKFSS